MLLLELKDLFQIKHEMKLKQVEEQKKIVEEEEKVSFNKQLQQPPCGFPNRPD